MKEFLDKCLDILMEFNKKFESINEKIYEQTKIKVNVGAYVLGAIMVIFLFFVIKGILGWVMGSLL